MKIGLLFLVFVAAIGVLMLPFMAHAEVTYTFWATDDAWVNEANPAVNYGNNSYLSVKDRSGLAEAYIRFNQRDLDFLAGKPISSASLFLYQYQGTNSPADTLSIHSINSDWSESTVTWDTRPAFDQPVASALNITGASNISGWREWPGLESMVSGWGGGSNFGIALENNLDNRNEELFARFYSSEYSEAEFSPNLKVTVTPEPVSGLLFIAGGASLALFRNRKKIAGSQGKQV
jgi:hypothetical protein